jgi:hypothetical protein
MEPLSRKQSLIGLLFFQLLKAVLLPLFKNNCHNKVMFDVIIFAELFEMFDYPRNEIFLTYHVFILKFNFWSENFKFQMKSLFTTYII